MNEYLIEDEYSFYEIDPECKMESLKEEQKGNKEKIEKSSRPKRASCSPVILLLLLLKRYK